MITFKSHNFIRPCMEDEHVQKLSLMWHAVILLGVRDEHV